MKATLSHLDPFRVPHPIAGDSPAGAPWGMFAIPHCEQWQRVQFDAHYIVCAADGEDLPDGSGGSGWDHISVHVRQTKGKKLIQSTPTWDDMEHLRSLFFDDDETVMQLSVPRTDHINVHPHVLHLWKPLHCAIPVPHKILV